MITMYVPPTLPIQEAFFEKVAKVNPGVQAKIAQIMRFISQKSSKRSPRASFFSWNLDGPSEYLKIDYESPKQDCMFLEATSQDLINLLVMQTLIVCSQLFAQPTEVQGNKSLSKIVRKFPTDLSGDFSTNFYCFYLLQNQCLGDTQSELL